MQPDKSSKAEKVHATFTAEDAENAEENRQRKSPVILIPQGGKAKRKDPCILRAAEQCIDPSAADPSLRSGRAASG